MALIKEKTIKGFTAEYWKITKANIDTMNATIRVELGLFKDRDIRLQGIKNMIDSKRFEWTDPAQFAVVAQMTVLQLIAYVYSKIKESNIIDGVEQNWFADSEDALEV